MVYSKSLLSVATFLLGIAGVRAGCVVESGNYYCNEVSEVLFTNVGSSGSYNDITNMDTSSCTCSHTSKSYSGPLAPLDEEVSFHFRGPIHLKHFAVYNADSSAAASFRKKRSLRNHPDLKKRDMVYVTEYVTEYINEDGSKYVDPASSTALSDYVSSYIASSSAAAATEAGDATTYATSTVVSTASTETSDDYSSPSSSATSFTTSTTTSSPSSSASSTKTSSTSASSGSGSGSWSRASYYEASSGTADNAVFLNNLGGSGSGVWSSCFGNSLSYAAADGVSCSSSSKTLNDVVVASNKEFSIWSSNKCDGDCGYYLPGIPAFHGFAGTKIVLFEFVMPHDYSSDYNQDMPAIWALNAKIGRTLQYGNADCSCWTTGCGEFDIFEVLNSGNEKMIASIHSAQGAPSGSNTGGGGSSDYFARPTSSSMIGAAIFDTVSSSIYVIDITDKGFSFGDSISTSDVENWFVDGATVVQLN
ncbi:fungal protein [Schizosaccharomyces japonicus yFS275]|uniref:glucan endo-1,3-beta-D-glucosidase n=1 Tax=Schizosaccharomyces japonicus (strain yFS275 / FY16936) TaxID=402676 RepID=B6JWV1_SCHJY|nr:fungal protein [Schizosaccharomyces japonicus yFS275]EEB05852.1 fungal protein [Schizosaccharomyces japonicus yFS275]